MPPDPDDGTSRGEVRRLLEEALDGRAEFLEGCVAFSAGAVRD
jgi:hypothetical protein